MIRRIREPLKLHVTHVVLQLHTGGMEKMLVEFARHADRGRFHLRFVCIGERGVVADEIAACGWEVKSLGYTPGLRPEIVATLAREFIRGRADVIHTHNNAPLIYSAPAARLAAGAAVLQTRHGQAVGTSRRHRAAVQIASMLARRIVCVSEDACRLSASEGIPERKLTVIRNGIDTMRYAYTGPAPDGSAVTIGRLVPAKGVDVLLRAVAVIAELRSNFMLHIAGDGPARPELEQLARSLGVTRHVRFLGAVDDVPGLLARSSLLIHPSLSEGIPLTVLEAMSRGLPVVATRAGGTPEVVEDGVSGCLVEPGDPVSLARAVVGLWPASARSRAMGEAGRTRVEQSFNVRDMVSRYEALYFQLARRSASKQVELPREAEPTPRKEATHDAARTQSPHRR